jgi:DnaJ-class molecular chaperone
MKRLFGIALAVGVAMMMTAAPVAAADHAAVGAEKCAKMCHKVQFESWATSKHATAAADKKADCETCHGNGADYMKMSVMKDPAKAHEAGLIAKPDQASCTKSCHKASEITAAKLATVHAHKAKAS